MKRVGRALILALAACGGNDGSTGPGPGNAAGTFCHHRRTELGEHDEPDGRRTGTNEVPGLVTITGTRAVSAGNATTITLTAGYLAGPGTYPLGVNFISTAGGSALVSTVQGSATNTWATGFSGNAGTIVVNSLTSNRIVGTFQFNAPPQQFLAFRHDVGDPSRDVAGLDECHG